MNSAFQPQIILLREGTGNIYNNIRTILKS